MRLGLRMVKGLGNEPGAQLVTRRGETSYDTVEEVWRRAGIPPAMLERLAEADAFRSMGVDRRQALWAVRGLADTVLPLFVAADGNGPPEPELVEPHVPLMPMKEGREVVEDYRSVGLSLGQHPVSFLRATLSKGHGDVRRPGEHAGRPQGGGARHRSGSPKARERQRCYVSPSGTRPAWPT